MATVKMTETAFRDFGNLPSTIQARVTEIVARLEKWPEVSGAKPLTGPLAGRFRIRTGAYRVQFYVKGDLVVIEKMGHRDGFYEE